MYNNYLSYSYNYGALRKRHERSLQATVLQYMTWTSRFLELRDLQGYDATATAKVSCDLWPFMDS